MSTKTIYEALRAAGMTREGACAIMGNMMVESTMRSSIVQRGMTTMSDADYTRAVDLGQHDFAHDSIGYGLCQWTYHTRKAALLAFARERGVSVGDEAMQVEFCILELRQDFPRIWDELCNSHSLYGLAERVCKEYERPAVNNIQTRFEFAQQYYEQFKGVSVEPFTSFDNPPASANLPQPNAAGDSVADWKIALVQWIMSLDGYWSAADDGRKSAEFFAAAKLWLEDAEKC